jgi:chitinase
MHFLRQQLSDPHHSPRAFLSEMAGESMTNFIEAQKVLLDLSKQQNEILMSAVKERVGQGSEGRAAADLLWRSLDTFIHTSSLRFDGIDLDWEFPAAADVTNFAALAREFRTQLNDAGRADGTHYLFSASVGINPDTYVGINPDGSTKWAEVQHSFDWLNLMTYNMNVPLANPGQHLTRFNAPLYPSPAEPVPPGPNVGEAVQAYLNAGVVPGKIVVGVDAYARSYAGVGAANGGLYQPYTGIGPGTWDRGYLSYQDVFENYLSLSGAPGWDDTTKSTSMYIPSERVWISPQMDGDVIAKAIYAVKNRLGGVMLWELGADMTDENSLLGYIATALRNTPD